MVDDLSDIFTFQIIFFNFNLQSTAQIQSTSIQITENHDLLSLPWILDFTPDSVTIAVIDLVQNKIFSSQEILLAAWQMLSSQRQDLLHNHLPRVAITQNQEGTMEMRDEVLSSVGLKTWTLAAIKYPISKT